MKIDKEYLLTDSTVNCYGFRLLTSGYQMPEYAKNPIGYYMHGTDEFPREMGVLVRWEDLRKAGDSVYGKPVINMNHPRGSKTAEEAKNGFLNAASFGQFVVLESSDDEKLRLPGQTGLTVTKWFNRECSLVDVPGNFNAVCLYDKDGNQISLQSLQASAKQLSGATIEERKRLIETAKENKDVSELEAESLTKLFNEPQFFSQALAMFKAQRIAYLNAQSYDDLESNGLLEEVKTKDFEGYKAKYKTKFGKDYGEQKAANLSGLAYLQTLSFDELDKKGLLPDLKQLDMNVFCLKFKEAFGRDYNDSGSSVNADANTKQPAKPQTNARLTYLQSLGWDELDKGGMLEELQKLDAQSFGDKFKAKFGKDWKPQKANIADKAKSETATKEEQQKRLSHLRSLSYDELDKQGLLPELKAADEPTFQAKYKSVFGKEYQQ